MNLDTAKKILNLHYAVSEDELKSLYRKLCLELHPDVNKSPNASDQFRELNSAYEFLRNNLPMLPPAPAPPPKGYKIFEIFKSVWPVIYVPDGIDEDVLLHYMWKDNIGLIRISKEIVQTAPCIVKLGEFEINIQKETALGEDPEPPIGTVWGRDYSIKRDQSQQADS